MVHFLSCNPRGPGGAALGNVVASPGQRGKEGSARAGVKEEGGFHSFPAIRFSALVQR